MTQTLLFMFQILKDRPLKNVPEPTADNIKKHLEDILEIYQVWRTNPSVRYDDDTGLQILQVSHLITLSIIVLLTAVEVELFVQISDNRWEFFLYYIHI